MVENLIAEHYSYAFNVLRRFNRPNEWIEDILQDASIKVFLSFDTLKDKAKFKSWFVTIALNTAKNDLRSHKRMEELSEHIPSQDEDLVVFTHNRQRVEEVIKDILDLPARQLKAMELRAVDGLAFKDIAEIMNCKYDTAKANYRHAVVKIRELHVEVD